MRIVLEASIIRVGNLHVAGAEVGGFHIRGAPAKSAEGAFKGLLWTLSGNGPQNDDAQLGLALLVQGTTLEAEVRRQALPPSSPHSDDGAAPSSEDGRVAEWMRQHPEQSYQDYLDEELNQTFGHPGGST
jgi:hypothetical protein